jgi:hypothetical protein
MFEDFWQSRECLSTVRQFARARLVAPWALLGGVLVRVVAAVPPQVRLPAITGGHASLNLYIGLVGAPAAGKGGAVAAATEAIDLPDVPIFGPGSGEGISHLFMRSVMDGKERKLQQYRKKAILYAPEVGTMNALRRRSASTLFPELNKAWMGEPLSWAYVRDESRIDLKAHSYRLCMIVGIQPDKADVILDDADAGTPQRFIWLPATDPEPIRGVLEPRPLNDPLWIRARSSNLGPGASSQDHLEQLKGKAASRERDVHLDNDERSPYEIPVCDVAREEIIEARLAGLRGEISGLEGHTQLAQLKVAAGLMYLEGREDHVSEEDWQLAGIVSGVSASTRQRVALSLSRAKTMQNAAQGEAEARREVIKLDRIAEHGVQRVGRRLESKIDGQWTPGAKLRRFISARDRQYFDDAVDALILAGVWEAREVKSARDGTEYRRHQ